MRANHSAARSSKGIVANGNTADYFCWVCGDTSTGKDAARVGSLAQSK